MIMMKKRKRRERIVKSIAEMEKKVVAYLHSQ